MPSLINSTLIACLAIALLLAVVDFVRRPLWRRFVIYALALGAVTFVLFMTTGFPFRQSRQAFGGTSSLLALALMFVGVLLGIAATYIFNLTGSFSWRDFA